MTRADLGEAWVFLLGLATAVAFLILLDRSICKWIDLLLLIL